MGACARHLPHGSKRKKKRKKKKEKRKKEGNLPFVITKTINCESSIKFSNTLCCLIRSGNAAALGILYTMLGPVLPSLFFFFLFFFFLFLFSFSFFFFFFFFFSFPSAEINYHRLRHAARRETL